VALEESGRWSFELFGLAAHPGLAGCNLGSVGRNAHLESQLECTRLAESHLDLDRGAQVGKDMDLSLAAAEAEGLMVVDMVTVAQKWASALVAQEQWFDRDRKRWDEVLPEWTTSSDASADDCETRCLLCARSKRDDDEAACLDEDCVEVVEVRLADVEEAYCVAFLDDRSDLTCELDERAELVIATSAEAFDEQR
jgi:hypothetical protein